MCFFMQISKDATELKHRFQVSFEEEDFYKPAIYNGFQFPRTPIITSKDPGRIELFQWGLIPPWAKDDTIQKSTLNARMETIKEKPSFKYIFQNRCLIIADAFFEWQWLDPKGKEKQKYKITLPDNQLFTFGGLCNQWVDPTSGEIKKTYTILTTEANELMSKIHNSKKRMPFLLAPQKELLWLSGKDQKWDPLDLIATPI